MRRSAAALALALLLPLPGLAGQVVVKQGETISDIADRYHVSVDRLLQLNGIRDPKSLQVGAKLTVPGAPSSPGRASGGPGGGAGGGARRGNYTVKSGETISEIADRYGISTNRLLELNGIRDPKGLQVGSRITVPTAGPAKAAKPASASGAPSPASRGPANYTVKSGETISEIADRYGISTNRLLELNGIRDPKGLQVGSRITVPTAGPAKPSKPPVLPALTAAQGKALSHTVRPGDTLSDIANTYGVPVERIAALNGLKDPDNLVPDTQLKLRNPPPLPKPAAKPTSRPPARTATKPPAHPASKPASKPAATTATTPAAKPASHPSTNSATSSQATPKPAETGPKPAASKPSPETAVTTKPAAPKPAESTQTGTKPAVTKPVVAKPVVTKPVETKPVVTKPVVEKPAATQAQTKPAQEPAAKPDSGAAGETALKPEAASKPETTPKPEVRPEPKPEAKPEAKPEVKAEVTTKAETAAKPAKTEAAPGKPAKPDWRNFGPLQVDWANWQPMGGSYVAPGLNATGQSLYLAVNCSAKRLNATGPSGAWKTWDLPTTDYEQQLVKDLCREKGG